MASSRRGGPSRPLGRPARARRRRLAFASFLAVLLLATGAGALLAAGAEAHRPVAAAGAGAQRPSETTQDGAPTPPPSARTPVPQPSPRRASPTAPAGPAASSASSGQPAWEAMPQGIASIISQFADDQGAAGVAVAVSTGTGATARARYLSMVGQAAADTPWSADTRSAYRSITKSLVGTVVLQLVGEGRLGLDDPLAEYVPEVSRTRYDGAAAGGRITVREALGMRTGLTEFSGTQDFSDRLDADYTGAFTDAELLGYAFAQPLDFAPGSQYEYSNTNSVLLGEVIRTVTGNSWDAEVQSRILGPLGLTSVAYSGSEEPAPPVATPYQASDAGLERLSQVSPSLYGASGGYFGTIGDLLTWGRALGSGSLVAPALQQDRLTSASDPGVDDPGSPEYDGYGLAAGTIDGWWGHTGTGLGYESLAMYSPSTGTTIAILVNTQLASPNGPAALFRLLEDGLENLR